jgi:hypothetical protein
MSRISVFESPETGRVVTDYSSLSLREIDKRIKVYQKKYGMPFTRYNRQFSCDEALPWETPDIMDWENLVEERAARQSARAKKITATRSDS